MSGEHGYPFALSICPVKDVVTGMLIILGRTCGKGKEAARKPILLWNVSLRNQAIAIDRAVPEFRRSHERESAQIPRSQMVEFLTSVG
jgi:hypothetical protein